VVDEVLVNLARQFLAELAGLDPDNEQERDTPRRYLEALRELTKPEPFTFTTFTPDVPLDEMIIERNIAFHSLCRHHVLSFHGVAHIAYVPHEKMAGLSKLARAVKFHAAGLRTQEELTVTIADYLVEQLDPLGVGVVMEAEHLCMSLRGVRSPGTITYSAAMRGVFGDHTKTAKAEFMSRINGGR
jgi:GTP cyclohydrolase I